MRVYEAFCECGGYIQSPHKGRATCKDCVKEVNVGVYLKKQAQEKIAKFHKAQGELRRFKTWVRNTVEREYVNIKVEQTMQYVITVGDSADDPCSTEAYFNGIKIVALGKTEGQAELNLHWTVEELGL